MNKRKAMYLLFGLAVIFLTFGLVLGCGGGESEPGGTVPDDGNPDDGSGGNGLTVGGNPYYGSMQVIADGSYDDLTTQLTFVFDQQLDSFTASNVTLSGVSGVTKGTVSYNGFGSANYYSGYRYVLPISGFTSNGSLNVRVGNMNTYVEIYYKVLDGGIYLGIIKFAGDAQGLNLRNVYGDGSNNDAPILLTSSILNNIISDGSGVLNYQYQTALQGSAEDGSAVYYAVHKALANLKSSENKFPDPDSVYIITFTDGKDNASTGASRDFPIEDTLITSLANYKTYIQSQIASRKIKNKNITAYSIGVKGSDIVNDADEADFTNLLQDIASSGNDRKLNNYDTVNATFNEIAENLIQGSNFSLTTTPLETGTKVRMTFDSLPTNATQDQITGAARYIEGTVNVTGTGASTTYTFNNITYGGITSDVEAGGSLTGTRTGSQIKYLFKNISGYNEATDRPNVKLWLKGPSDSIWTITNENQFSKADFGTAVIYLVLDRSSSVGYSNIYSISNTVKNFITKIYNSRYNTNY